MNKLANIRFVPLGNSIYIKPFKMLYEQVCKLLSNYYKFTSYENHLCSYARME